ncbi:MAG: dephospho-CoA kinase [Methylophilaceae bacterium]
MYIVALTGGIGSGKSEATNFFATLGVPIIDLDTISHQLTAANKPLASTIATIFGDDYLTQDGALDRVKMRKLVFNNDKARTQLNALLHPEIYKEAMKQVKMLENESYLILSIPLLTKNNPYAPLIDRVLTIDCDEKTQIERVKMRSKLSEAEIKKIIQTQASRQERLDMTDDVINNCGKIEELRQNIENLHQKYIKTCIVSKTIS